MSERELRPDAGGRQRHDFVRRAVRRLGRNRSFRRRLPSDFGGAILYASTEGGLKYLRRNVEDIDPQLLGLARRLVESGARVWDIGANVGLFTLAAAARAGEGGEVIAVEPDVWLVQLLRRSQRDSSSPCQIHIVPAAVADHVGLMTFYVANNSRATNFLEGAGSTQTHGAREQQLVPTLTLDVLLERFSVPDVVKIDVERAELRVLQGADVLLDYHPTLLMEVGPGVADEVTDLLRSRGYRLYSADSRGNLQRAGAATYTTVAVPASGGAP